MAKLSKMPDFEGKKLLMKAQKRAGELLGVSNDAGISAADAMIVGLVSLAFEAEKNSFDKGVVTKLMKLDN